MDLLLNGLLAVTLLALVVAAALVANRRLPLDDIRPGALDQVLGLQDDHGHGKRQPDVTAR